MPLVADLTPVPDRPDILFGTRPFTIWFDIKETTVTPGVSNIQPAGTLVQRVLANARLIAPSVSPVYEATFSNVDDAVSMTIAFNGRAFGATLADTILTAYNPLGFTLNDVADTLNDFMDVPAILKVLKVLTPLPKTPAQLARAAAQISYDLTFGLSYADFGAIELILKKQYGKDFTNGDIYKGAQKIFSGAAVAKMLGDAVYLGRSVNFNDAAMTVRFVASPLNMPK